MDWLRLRRTAALTLGALLVGTAVSSAPLLGARPVHADEPTISVDPLRTGWDPVEPGLAPSQVSSSDFGQQFSTAVNGAVYAQPVVAGSTVIVATEKNQVYGISADGGGIVWSRPLGAAWPASAIGCGDLVPTVGVTSTPVYDKASGTVYLTSKVNDGTDARHPHWYVHALNAANGDERSGWPVQVAGAPVNDPTRPFNAFTAMQRPGLMLMNGQLFAAFGSHCDIGPYVGYLLSVNVSTRQQSLWATENAASSNQGGVWMSGGGPVSDGSGRILLTTGNGVSPAPGAGSRPPGALAESVVRLGVNGDGSVTAHDFFSPSNAPMLDQNDTDLGSGGPAGLPEPTFGTSAHPHLLVQVGKDGRVFLLDRDNLGGRGASGNAVLGTAGPFGGVWGHPGVWGGNGGYVYLVQSRDRLLALKYGVTGSGQPALSAAGSSAQVFGYTSGSPVVTSTGTTSSSALVWVEYSSGSNGTNGHLDAYDAVPVSGVMKLRYSASIGTVSKFAVPATDGGRVFVGTRDGHVLAFGRPADAALLGKPVDFGNTAVSSTADATATVTATRAVTVNALSVPGGAPFSVTPLAAPVALTANQTFSAAVHFAPTAAGTVTGLLRLSTSVGDIDLDLTGNGTQPGFSATPPSMSFGTVATGATRTLGVTITNTGTAPETITATTAPTAPFSAPDLASLDNRTLAAQTSVSVQVTYAPTVARDDSSSLSLSGPDGTVTVPLSGSAVTGQAKLTLTPTTTNYGPVPVGWARTLTFDISNAGNIPLTVSKAAPPAAPFLTPDPISEGQSLSPGDVVHQSVTFRPTAAGSFSGVYQINSNDGNGAQNELFSASSAAATWAFNGSAKASGGDLVLTPASKSQTGSAIHAGAVPTTALHAHFSSVIGGGTGADGTAFVLLDAARATTKALGSGGGGLGYSGLPGVAVLLDTYKDPGNPSANFVAVATGGVGAKLTFAATSTSIGNLRQGVHAVDVTVTASNRVVVAVDGKQVINVAVAVPPNALVGFTAATGGLTDTHTVRGVSISY